MDAVGRGHDDDSRVTVATEPFPLDLLSLEGGTFATFGVVQLPAGEVDSLRLVLQDGSSNYVVTSAGVTLPLIVLRPVIRLREVDMTGACPDTDQSTQPPSKGHGEGAES